jgi:uncharacterized protein
MTDPGEPSPGQHLPTGTPGFTPPYGPPPYGLGAYPPPPGWQSDDTMWSLLAHLGQPAFGFIAPLVVYLARRNHSPFIRFHAAQALNAALSYMIVVIGGVLIAFFSLPGHVALVPILAILLVFVLAAVHVIYLIIGALKIKRGEMYRLPVWLCWRIVR